MFITDVQARELIALQQEHYAALALRDDRQLAERLSAKLDAAFGPDYVADRVLALWQLIGRLRDALRTAAQAPRAPREIIEEFEWFTARLTSHSKPGTRAEPPWLLLNAYGWLWSRLLLSDGPSLLASWDAWTTARGDLPLRRIREGRAEQGQGRRPGPLVEDALATATLQVADLLAARRVVATHDHLGAWSLLRKARAIQEARRRPIADEQGVEALVEWAATWLFLAAQLTDYPFSSPRSGRESEARARFREAARAGADSPAWIAAVDELLFRNPVVAAALDARATRRATGNFGAPGGPRKAAAVAVAIVTGVSATTIGKIVREHAPIARRAPARRSAASVVDRRSDPRQ